MSPLFVVSGPSGCGKTTLVKRVLKEMDTLAFLTSFTTRKKRDSEIEGKDYFFVSKEVFTGMIDRAAFAEWAEVHGHLYGTSRNEIEQQEKGLGLILDIDIQGARQIRKMYKNAISIFIFPPRFDELKRRLSERGDETEESIQRRLANAKREILSYPDFNYIIINDRLEKAVRELEGIVLSVSCHKDRRREDVRSILETFAQGE